MSRTRWRRRETISKRAKRTALGTPWPRSKPLSLLCETVESKAASVAGMALNGKRCRRPAWLTRGGDQPKDFHIARRWTNVGSGVAFCPTGTPFFGAAMPQAAIGIVCKAPEPGQSKTRLIPRLGADKSALARAFLIDIAESIGELRGEFDVAGYAVCSPAE